MTMRVRLIALATVVVVAVAGAVWYVLSARNEHRAANERAAAEAPLSTVDPATVAAVPHLAFRTTALGEGYGRLALVALGDPGGERAVAPASCDRVYARAGVSVCLVAERGLVTRYHADVLDGNWAVSRRMPVAGLPSRARMSPDGTLLATTTFVTGDSYASPGQFSTRTVVVPTTGGEGTELESFKLMINGRNVTAVDRNLWGVTFARDNRTFYATAATGGGTYLVRGDLSARTLTSIRADVECPSLSPDGRRIAFKKHGTLPAGQWRLAVYDLESGKETLLAETKSVDDQAEWLDDSTVLYGMPRSGQNGTTTSDVWAVPADGGGAPRVLVEDAWSPAVVRPGA
jgi:dipeptidyl aminopeptidase/acylaminoacyl peptidase